MCRRIVLLVGLLIFFFGLCACDELKEGPSDVTIYMYNHYDYSCHPMDSWVVEVDCSGYHKSRSFSEENSCYHKEKFNNVPDKKCTFRVGNMSVKKTVDSDTKCEITFERVSEWRGGLVPSPTWNVSGLDCD